MTIWQRLIGWRIPEPKGTSVIVAIGYIAFTLTGVITLLNPPTSLSGEVGKATMTLVGMFFLVGGVVGMIAGATEYWQLERVGITGMGVGLATYAYIVAGLHLTQPGSRLTQLGVIFIAACFLMLRVNQIWGRDFKPRG